MTLTDALRISARRAASQAVTVAALLSGTGGPAHAQAVPAYHPLQLDCARYRQEIKSVILLEGGRTRTRETTSRDGVLVLRATAAGDTISLVAWFDTLTVWREGAGERLEPGTDGVIGGKFKGMLTPAGSFTSTDRPFVPDDIAQVADVGDALEQLLPRLPPGALAPGASWKGQDGTVITRMSDGSSGGRRAERYRLVARSEGEERRLLPDSSLVRAERRESESGVFEWQPEVGVVRWEREVTVDVKVPAEGVVRQPFRTRIEQQVTVTRVAGGCPDRTF